MGHPSAVDITKANQVANSVYTDTVPGSKPSWPTPIQTVKAEQT